MWEWFGDIGVAYAAWFAGMGSVIKVFDGIDKRLSKEAREDVSAYVLSIDVSSRLSDVARMFHHAFETVFGPRHLSFKCYLRSVIASIVTSILVSAWLLPGSLREGVTLADVWFELLSAIVMFALIPDFISIGKSRWLIRRMENGSVSKILGLLAIDVVLSFAIAAAWLAFSFWVATTLLDVLFENLFGPTSNLELVMFAIAAGFEFFPIGAISTCLTSIWAVLFALSVLILRASGHITTTWRFLGRTLDFREKPFGSVGMVIVAIATLGFTITSAVRWVASLST